ncbi:class F sortase [Amycolatopsis sp. NPDC051128]|uniref:class F sortase n=1 Tax=Amycolatopsis sp. NPDC051128 TaxID=3155412 RepID=UPI00344AC574
MRHPRLWPAVTAVAAALGVVVAVALLLVFTRKAPEQIAPPSPAATSATTTAAETAGRLPAAKPASLTIPAIGVRADRITDLGLADRGELEVPGDATTVGWFTGAPSPGEAGPAVLVAHGDTAEPELRIITCGGAFDRSSGNYLGNYLDNVVAYARLTAVEA